MRNLNTLLLAVSLAALSMGGAHAQTKGDWVLAKYRNGAHYYPGILQGTSEGKATVAYDDGDVERLPLAAIRPYDWAIGTKVECNFQGKGDWFRGRISSLSGGDIGIAYDDGDKERTNTGRCRSH